MNKTNVTILRDFMMDLPEDKFDIGDFFFSWEFTEDCQNLKASLHNCGTSACIVGWAVMLPEFIEEFGNHVTKTPYGYASIEVDGRRLQDGEVLAYWLDIPKDLSNILCMVSDNSQDTYSIYGVDDSDDITAGMVAERLDLILHDESLTFE